MTPYLNEQLGCEGSMSQHDTLTRFSRDMDGSMEPDENGSWVRFEDAQAALSATQPSQAHWTEREPVRLASSRVGRVYIAGPMTGIEEFNFPAFNAEAAKLRGEGMAVLNPAEHGIVDGAEWADYLRHDIAGLASCERTHMLRGWEKSKGAQLEVTIAQALGMQITYQEGAEPAQAAQAEPAEHWHRLYLEKCQQYNDRVAQLGAEIEGLEAEAAQGAGEVAAELKRLASVCPELNLNNYGPDDVDELNAWAIEVAQAIDQLSDTQPAAGADVPTAQPAPVVPDGTIDAMWSLYADTNTVMRLERSQFAHLVRTVAKLLAATPTPPAQAAADARDAILFESSLWGGEVCRLAVWESLRILGSRMGVTVTKEDQYAALATHQQRQDGIGLEVKP